MQTLERPSDEPVTGVTKITIAAIEAPALLSEAVELLLAESKELPGFLGGQVLLSVDNKTLVILAEWTDTHAWSQARYDARVGRMMEHCLAKSSTIEFELYTRHGTITQDIPRPFGRPPKSRSA